MGLFSQSQADKLAEVRRAVDKGTATPADLIAEVRKSTGSELDDAMDQYDADDYNSWGNW